MNEEELKEDEQLISRQINSMLAADVYYRLEAYCKKVSLTGIGKWDFGVGIRSLLDKAEKYDTLVMRIEDLENRVKEIEAKKEDEEVSTFGRR